MAFFLYVAGGPTSHGRMEWTAKFGCRPPGDVGVGAVLGAYSGVLQAAAACWHLTGRQESERWHARLQTTPPIHPPAPPAP
eukprot:COSAG01_NODE_843_length_13172_cov_84.009791_3_plen_81_part_00